MMPIRLSNVLLVSALLALKTMAQPGWTQQNPLPTGHDLNSVFFFDASTGFAVGNHGTMLKTTNGGETWIVQHSGTVAALLGVSFTDWNNGTAVGGTNGSPRMEDRSVILRTTNGGTTWARQSCEATHPLRDVFFTDDNTSTVVGDGGFIARTTDGGATWSTQSSGTIYPLYRVCFSDDSTGFAVGGMNEWKGALTTTILRTTDRGVTWTDLAPGNYGTLLAVCFTDATTGTVVGQAGAILRTTDGGSTWKSQPSGTTNDLKAVYFTDANTGLATGVNAMLRTTDGGATWENRTPEASFTLADFSFADAITGTAVGNSGIILRTTNGGETWLSQSSTVTRAAFTGVSFADGLVGIAVGTEAFGPPTGTIFRTTNGGADWELQWWQQHTIIQGLTFTDAMNGTVFGYENPHEGNPDLQGVILRTTDGGIHWTDQSATNLLNIIPYGAYFTDPNNGTLVGSGGVILHTTDGGATWTGQLMGESIELRGVSFADTNNGVVVGLHNSETGFVVGVTLRTTDGGETWADQSGWTRTNTLLNSVSFVDPDNGTAVGGRIHSIDSSGGTWTSAFILHTTDGGATWVGASFDTLDELKSVCFTDVHTGTTVGGSTILRTSDGGVTWSKQSCDIAYGLNAVFFSDANTGTAVGADGLILHTTTGGTTWVGRRTIEAQPAGFVLHQNYPNPFNPTTVVSGRLTADSWVRLGVYDVLGRKVATLTDAKLHVGRFSYVFDARNLASGVYFCRMTAGSFRQTRAMMLAR